MFLVSFVVLVFLQVVKVHLQLIPLIMGLKTVRGALTTNLS
jgi:hypothetical protein